MKITTILKTNHVWLGEILYSVLLYFFFFFGGGWGGGGLEGRALGTNGLTDML